MTKTTTPPLCLFRGRFILVIDEDDDLLGDDDDDELLTPDGNQSVDFYPFEDTQTIFLAISQPKIKLQYRRSNPTGEESWVSGGGKQRTNRWPDDEGRNGGATMKAVAVRRGRQRRCDDKGRNGGATTKGTAAR